MSKESKETRRLTSDVVCILQKKEREQTSARIREHRGSRQKVKEKKSEHKERNKDEDKQAVIFASTSLLSFHCKKNETKTIEPRKCSTILMQDSKVSRARAE